MNKISQIKIGSVSDNVWNTQTPPPINLSTKNWAIYLPSDEPQRFIYDLDECSQLGGFINPMETYFNWLKPTGQISQAFQDFLNGNNSAGISYYDSNGSHSFSERFTAILDGTTINGNTPQNAFICFQRYGLIPRSMLNWTLADAAQYPNQALMDTSYYNPAVINQQMIDLGKQFLTFIKEIGWGWPGGLLDGQTTIPIPALENALMTSPIAIAIPTPDPVSLWNQVKVPYTGGTQLQHCVFIYNIDQINNPDYPIFFMNQYNPYLKQFPTNYFIPFGIIFFVIPKLP